MEQLTRIAVVSGAIVILVLVLLFAPETAAASAIADVSWPNCTLSSVSGQWGIVGVTGGLDLHPNKCVAAEAGWFNHYALYMNTGYPGSPYVNKFASSPRACDQFDETCVAYDYGYNASLYAIKYAASQDVHSNLWWLDVETDNSWATNVSLNRDSLQGSIDALRQSVIFTKIGIYSYPAQWQTITKGWQIVLPAWVATGSTVRSVAQQTCRQPSFDGGPVWLSQYTPNLDISVPCSQQFFQTIF